MTLVREHVIRRLVMERHLEAARNGVVVRLHDNVIILDLALDLARYPGAFAFVPDVIDEVEADPFRPSDPSAAGRHRR